MSITITSFGTHNVVAPVDATSIVATELNLETPIYDDLVVMKSRDTANSSGDESETYRLVWMGERINQPFGAVSYKTLAPRSLYRGIKVPSQQRLPSINNSIPIGVSSQILLEDQNSATGEVLKIPFRASLTLECPWDYVGMDETLFKRAFQWCLGLMLTNFGAQEARTPTVSPDLESLEDMFIDMFSGDLDPRTNNLAQEG